MFGSCIISSCYKIQENKKCQEKLDFTYNWRIWSKMKIELADQQKEDQYSLYY